MSLPDQTPKLPKLPFLIGDAFLLFAAWFIVDQSRGPLGGQAIIAITACVAVGAVLTAIPFLSDYARRQDEALDERQRGLEALSRTVNTAAEQISIAANGMHEIVELAHKNLKHAEQLPQKLQEKIAEFNAQLDNAREDDREELEKELAELRTSESERLQAVADRVHKDLAELARLEAAVQKQIAARSELLGRAQETAIKAQTDAAAALQSAAEAVSRSAAAAEAKAAGELEARLSERTSAAVAAINAAVSAAAQTLASSVPSAPASPAPTPDSIAAAATLEVASPPKKPRKSRREEPATAESPSVGNASPSDLAAAPFVTSEPAAATVEPPAAAVSDPVDAPAPTAAVPEPDATAAAAAQPAPPVSPVTDSNVAPANPVAPSEPPAPATPAPAAPAERAPRKRNARRAEADSGTELPLEPAGDGAGVASDEAGVSRSEVVERVISSDGATRLIVTAYIGIGNRIFIRGDGPGLSWDKGVPLQFVSIGKWRWETMEATAPVAFKLYKNDETECSALGRLTLVPGHQEEVTAKF